MTVALALGATTVAGAAASVIRCWIIARYRVALAREYDQTLLRVLPKLQTGCQLVQQMPDGSLWLLGASALGAAPRKGSDWIV